MSARVPFKDFLTELRRRRVGRVAVGYAVGAWLLVEIADTVFPRLLIPDWTVSALIGIAIIGFPVAVMLAWWFDVVPDATSPRRRRRWLAPVLLSLIVIMGAAFASSRFLPRLIDPVDIESVVVLPFDNVAGEADEDYYVSGMHDEVIAELSQVSSLRVISRRSAVRYKAASLSIPEIAKELNVDAIVEGAVQRTSNGVEVRVALIRAFPQERQVWTQAFTRAERDVRTLQGEIARNIAQQIRVKLTPAELTRLSDAPAVDPKVYELYLRGMYLIDNRRSGREDVLKGIDYLRQAIDVNPADAHSYAALADAYATMGHAWIHVPDAWAQARTAALRAVTLDPNLAEAHGALAKIKMYYEWDWEGAGRAFQKANELNPNLASNRYHYAHYLRLFDRLDEAIKEHELAKELDPYTPAHTAWLGSLYLAAGRADDGLREARRAIEVAPNAPGGWVVLGGAYVAKQMYPEAIAAHQQLVKLNPLGKCFLGVTYARIGKRQEALRIADELKAAPMTPFIAFGLASIYAWLGDKTRAFEWLDYKEPHAWVPWVRVLPEFEAVRADPRYDALRTRLKLPAN
jgi:TolB-like protein/Tfp pilus assembly protein PilF